MLTTCSERVDFQALKAFDILSRIIFPKQVFIACFKISSKPLNLVHVEEKPKDCRIILHGLVGKRHTSLDNNKRTIQRPHIIEIYIFIWYCSVLILSFYIAGSENAPAKHDHCPRNDRKHHWSLQWQDLQPGGSQGKLFMQLIYEIPIKL